MLREQLGDDHVFITSLKLGRIVKTENESGRGVGNDPIKRGRSTSEMHGSNKVHVSGSKGSYSQGTMQYVSSKVIIIAGEMYFDFGVFRVGKVWWSWPRLMAVRVLKA